MRPHRCQYFSLHTQVLYRIKRQKASGCETIYYCKRQNTLCFYPYDCRFKTLLPILNSYPQAGSPSVWKEKTGIQFHLEWCIKDHIWVKRKSGRQQPAQLSGATSSTGLFCLLSTTWLIHLLSIYKSTSKTKMDWISISLKGHSPLVLIMGWQHTMARAHGTRQTLTS